MRGLFIPFKAVALTTFLAILAGPLNARIPDKQDSSSEEDIKAALTGGVPLGRWEEGLLFDGIKPQPWLKSAANYFPGTEKVQPDEMRITFMGTSPMVRPGQAATSILVELTNLFSTWVKALLETISPVVMR